MKDKIQSQKGNEGWNNIAKFKTNLRLDEEIQHLKHFQEGYREYMLTMLYDEQKLEDVGIDVDRYSPDSARRISYEQGCSLAKQDFDGM